MYYGVLPLKIGVLSDTHKRLDLAIAAIEEMGAIDLLVHAGDHYRDAKKLMDHFGVPGVAVAGNCDITGGSSEEILELAGRKVLVVHGHRQGVKGGLQNLWYYALERDVEMVIFGHSHIPVCQTVDGITMFNPGSLTEPRDLIAGATYGIITIDQGVWRPEIIKFVGKT